MGLGELGRRQGRSRVRSIPGARKGAEERCGCNESVANPLPRTVTGPDDPWSASGLHQDRQIPHRVTSTASVITWALP